MNMRMTGAALRGNPQLAQPTGASGRDLRQMPDAAQEMAGQPAGESDELNQAIGTLIEAAKSAGFDMPAEGVTQEQLPQVYQQLLQAAAKSDMGATDGGIALIERMARTLGLPSPFEPHGEGPDYVFGGEEPQPFGGASPRAPMAPDSLGDRRPPAYAPPGGGRRY